jgi:hypothetical protein
MRTLYACYVSHPEGCSWIGVFDQKWEAEGDNIGDAIAELRWPNDCPPRSFPTYYHPVNDGFEEWRELIDEANQKKQHPQGSRNPKLSIDEPKKPIELNPVTAKILGLF